MQQLEYVIVGDFSHFDVWLVPSLITCLFLISIRRYLSANSFAFKPDDQFIIPEYLEEL